MHRLINFCFKKAVGIHLARFEDGGSHYFKTGQINFVFKTATGINLAQMGFSFGPFRKTGQMTFALKQPRESIWPVLN